MATASPSQSANSRTLSFYLHAQLEARLRKVAFALRNTRQAMTEEQVHDLRVALRRLIESVRVAKHVLHPEGAQSVLRDLRKIMRPAGELRSCDIAANLLTEAGADPASLALQHLTQRREQAERKLYEHAQVAYRRNATMKWRAALVAGVSS